MKPINMTIALALILCTAGCITVRTTVNTDGHEATLRHIVLLRFKTDAPPAEIERVLREFRGLEDAISAIDDFEFGVESSGRDLNQGFNHGGIFTFDSQTDLDTYRNHEAHLEFVERSKPVIDAIFVYDYYAESE